MPPLPLHATLNNAPPTNGPANQPAPIQPKQDAAMPNSGSMPKNCIDSGFCWEMKETPEAKEVEERKIEEERLK